MWNAPLPIFEDEDEAELISEFVRLSAKHPARSALEVARYVFRKLRDPGLRAGQAAMQWADDLDIQERIDAAKLVGEVDSEIDTKKAKLKVLEGIYKDDGTSPKDKIAAIQLHAQIQGEIVKAIEATTTDRTTRFPQIIATIYDDEES